MQLRILPDLTASGAIHMASDEALLAVAEVPTLRLYSWSPATVSLGYFQDYALIAAVLPPGLPVVRRITGGGAIWHEHEVTYALVGKLGQHGLPTRTRDLYPLIHSGLHDALQAAGAMLERQPESVGDRRYASEPRCFASPATDDLVHPHGGKVLGSAARARGERVLVHGSLKLATNPWDGVATAGCGLAADQVREIIRATMPRVLGLTLVEGEWQPEEIAARDELLQIRYGDRGWVERRAGPRA